MALSTTALGMNARNYLFIRPYNKPRGKRIADDKLATKRALARANITVPRLMASFKERSEIREYPWHELRGSFVIKPARGYGGEGIIVMSEWDHDTGIDAGGTEYTIADIESHLFDILDGAYSLHFAPDVAFIEERLIPHRFFKKMVPVGIPDIRIIVFNGVPVMAMLRLPTPDSGGKANLHQGAIGVGVDIRTGITTHCTFHNHPVTFLPGTKIKVRGHKIPHWTEMLMLAARTQHAVHLGYVGVDIVLDNRLGPVVLEVNARPGLSIQNANQASLRTRLERVERMSRPGPERGVEIAQSLFAEPFAEKVITTPKTLGIIEPVLVKGPHESINIEAKIDTGAYRTSLDAELVEKLGLVERDENVLVQSASGRGKRPIVDVSFVLGGKTVHSAASVADRSHLSYPMIIGRRDMRGFVVDPNRNVPSEGDDTGD